MRNEKATEALKALLGECATPGTVWNRHLHMGDVIDIWREANGCLIRHGVKPIPFEDFYSALQAFRGDNPHDLDRIAATLISAAEARAESVVEGAGPPGKKRVA